VRGGAERYRYARGLPSAAEHDLTSAAARITVTATMDIKGPGDITAPSTSNFVLTLLGLHVTREGDITSAAAQNVIVTHEGLPSAAEHDLTSAAAQNTGTATLDIKGPGDITASSTSNFVLTPLVQQERQGQNPSYIFSFSPSATKIS
jgi:hypothetical protein